MKLDKRDFKIQWLDRVHFYFSASLHDGYEICLEPYMSGFDVALYKHGEIVGNKVCTHIDLDVGELLMLMEYGEPFTLTGRHLEALEPAMIEAQKIADTL